MPRMTKVKSMRSHIFLHEIAASQCDETGMTTEVFRHRESETNVYVVGHTSLAGLLNPSLQRLPEIVEISQDISPSRFVVIKINNGFVGATDLRAVESTMRSLAAGGVPTCLVLGGSVRPEFIRHHLVLAAPDFASSVADAIILLTRKPLRNQIAA
jgi:hypothetical protein